MDRRQFERRERKNHRTRNRRSDWEDRKNHADLIERSIIGKITFLLRRFFLLHTLKTRPLRIALIACRKKGSEEGRKDRFIFL